MSAFKHFTIVAGLLLATTIAGNAAVQRLTGPTSDPVQDNFTRCSFALPDSDCASESPIPDCAIVARLVE